jgi:glycosyltransferase involved in cell wall biosynthesis
MNLFYWSPFLSKVATVRAVLNSAISVSKYSKKLIHPHIINSYGEWNEYKDEILENNIGLVNFAKDSKKYQALPRYGYIKSRASYLIIFLSSFYKLFSFLKSRNNNDYILIHLISSLPLILAIIFNFKCKFILRISGYPKMNIFRKLLWKRANKNLFLIFCPTLDTKKYLHDSGVFDVEKLSVLYDPIIEFKKSFKKKNDNFNELNPQEFILSVGRLTKQKNHKFLIKNFKDILNIFPKLKLVILGEGELKYDLINQCQKLNIQKNIIFKGHVDNVYKYYKNALCFVLSSDWEDPGFVLIEAACSRTAILSADCPNGPKEFLKNDVGGYLYKQNDEKSFIEKFQLLVENKKNYNKVHQAKILYSLKKSKNYTNFRHFINLSKTIIANKT